MISKFAILIVTFAAGLSGLAIWHFAPTRGEELRAPSDQQLIALFQSHRTLFEKYRKIASSSNSAFYLSREHLEALPSQAQKKEALADLSELGDDVSISGADETIRFIFARKGTSALSASVSKGIEYIPSDVERHGSVKSNLDSLDSLPMGDVYLRQIDSHWFVVVQKLD